MRSASSGMSSGRSRRAGTGMHVCDRRRNRSDRKCPSPTSTETDGGASPMIRPRTGTRRPATLTSPSRRMRASRRCAPAGRSSRFFRYNVPARARSSAHDASTASMSLCEPARVRVPNRLSSIVLRVDRGAVDLDQRRAGPAASMNGARDRLGLEAAVGDDQHRRGAADRRRERRPRPLGGRRSPGKRERLVVTRNSLGGHVLQIELRSVSHSRRGAGRGAGRNQLAENTRIVAVTGGVSNRIRQSVQFDTPSGVRGSTQNQAVKPCTRRLNVPLRACSDSHVPCSTTRPCSNTTIQSASRMVDSRCAMTTSSGRGRR